MQPLLTRSTVSLVPLKAEKMVKTGSRDCQIVHSAVLHLMGM